MSVKIAVLAPMPRASESAATARKTGDLRRVRRVYGKSCRIGAIVRNTAQCGKIYLRKPRNPTFLTFFTLTIYRSRHNLLVDCLEKRGGPNQMQKPKSDLLQGTLDLLILKTLELEPMHGWGISQRIQQVSEDVLQVNQGSLYPALHRLEDPGWISASWNTSANNRQTKHFTLSRL